jgi:putative MATE family efflux protein
VKQDLTTGTPWKVLLAYSLPVVGGNIFQLFYTLADSVIVGQTLGAQALAAVGTSGVISYFFLCFIQGCTSGFSILIGQAFGAHEQETVKRNIAASFVLSAILSLCITVATCAFCSSLLRLMNTPQDIFQEAYDYLFVIFLGTGATMFYNMIANMLRALGDSRTPLYFLVFSSLLNIILDLVFILVFGWGVAGAAWATILSQLFATILCYAYSLRNFPEMRVEASFWKWDGHRYWTLFKLGFPMGFQLSIMSIGQMAMQAAVNLLGTTAATGYTAANKVNQIAVLVNNGIGVAISGYVAQNYGAKRLDRVKRGVWACFLMAVVANLAIVGFIFVLQDQIVTIFISDPTTEIVGYAKDFFRIVVPFYAMLGGLQTFRSATQGLGSVAGPFVSSVVQLAARIVGSFLLGAIWGYRGICFASPMAWISAVVVLVPIYLTTMKRAGRELGATAG